MPWPKVFFVEYGPLCSDPCKPMVMCPTEAAVRDYINIMCRSHPDMSPSMFHITEVAWKGNTQWTL